MGLARQSVQRIADLLVDKSLAEYLPNPAHARAKLVSAQVSVEDLRTTLATMTALVAATS
jgi:DNA-binding MarR family transcriptional regulator